MSSLFNLKPPLKEKPITKHPWQDTIKDTFCHKIKHAHNSVKNPLYPKIKGKKPDADRIKFTVIGDRVTEEFIYCVHLVKGMHKYRWKKFDVPTIRGVNTVEWPDVWGGLKLKYGGLAYCLKSSVAVLVDDQFLGGEKELKEFIETKYIYHLVLDYRSEAIANFVSYIRCSGRPCAYMHIMINEEPVGTLIFMLFADLVPYTCENFLRLCRDTKGGYGGTPIHRIVADGWIQGGGFGLKSTDLDCENFIIPHDRRGVLCMANDGRHVDCSTQFFVLLQPAPWMAQKYVAFGQLIEGHETLKKIEEVSTWYESPMSNIIIYKAGILNMECQDIKTNTRIGEYIAGHIEDLNALGDVLIETLIDRVFLEVDLRSILYRITDELPGEHEETDVETTGNIRTTKRFLRNKEEIEEQIHRESDRGPIQSQKLSTVANVPPIVKQNKVPNTKTMSESENNDFDVEDYEPEETDYKHISLATTLSLVVKPEVPFYIPLTDVPYPEEVDSVYNLKKLLKGHYCLESDLDPNMPKAPRKDGGKSFLSELFEYYHNLSESESEVEMDSNDEKEIKEHFKEHVDDWSYAGSIIKGIARTNLRHVEKTELINDDQLRRLRMAAIDLQNYGHSKKVSISVPIRDKASHAKIKRRPTGYIYPEDIEKALSTDPEFKLDEENEDVGSYRKVRIIPPPTLSTRVPSKILRRQKKSASGRPSDFSNIEDDELARQSVLQRLYDEVSNCDDSSPRLMDYRPFAESNQKKNIFLLTPFGPVMSDKDIKENYFQHSFTFDELSYERVLNLQYGKKIQRKMSSDYAKTIDQIEHRMETSLRSTEFAKTRPCMTVSEYQLNNRMRQANLKTQNKTGDKVQEVQ